MKRQMIVRAAFSALMGLAALPSHAQSGGVRVNVPFKFQVANRMLPEGEYLISSSKDNVFVQNAQGRTVAMVQSNAVTGRAAGATGKIVFQCYEKHCFLSELWSPTAYAGRQLPKSHREEELAKKEAAKKEAPIYFALAGAPNNKHH